MRSLPLLFLMALIALAGCTQADIGAIADAHQTIYGGRPYLTTDRPRPLTCIDLGGGVLRCR